MNLNDYERGAIYGTRHSIARLLDHRSSTPRLSVSSMYAEDEEALEAARHLSLACQALKRLEERIGDT